jgi:hypothetical protein
MKLNSSEEPLEFNNPKESKLIPPVPEGIIKVVDYHQPKISVNPFQKTLNPPPFL